jgi:hypothetical protein
LIVDDGEFLVFQIVSDGGAVVTATLGIKRSSGPATWVEAVKYGYRAQVDLQVI